MLSQFSSLFLALHFIFVVAWMAGLLYLPRLFIYHLEFEVNSKPYQTFCIMEKRLLRIIMLPAILLTFLFGSLLAFAVGAWESPWFHVKFLLVLLLGACHGYFARIARQYREGTPPSLSKRALLFLNEVPFVLMILIVFLAIFKPS